MSALTSSVFAALLMQCAPDAPADYMQRIVAHESGFRPYAMHDNTSGASLFPESYQEAVTLAVRILRAGHNLDVGLGQINQKNWKWLGLTVETALDPCQNVRAEARVLSSMSRYNTGDSRRGLVNGYVQKVLAARQPSGDSQQPDQKLLDEIGSVSEQGELPPDADRITTTYEGDK